MISGAEFKRIVGLLGEQGQSDIAWAEALVPPTDADDFALEIIFVICNSGMKNTVARTIYQLVKENLLLGRPALGTFGHKGKCAAMDHIWSNRERLLAEYMAAPDKLAYAASLPWIGDITKYHVVKNFGADVVKPDVHLARLAKHHQTTPHRLCVAISRETGFRIATVDTILWRACANGIINSRTGVIQEAA